jgi:hypothetical protein
MTLSMREEDGADLTSKNCIGGDKNCQVIYNHFVQILEMGAKECE